MPKRIQRKRIKGWKMPGGVYIGRPSMWGNPFSVRPVKHNSQTVFWEVFFAPKKTIVERYIQTRAAAVQLAIERYELWLSDGMTVAEKLVQELYSDDGKFLLKIAREQLKGKDLICWCKEGEPCHGDILLRKANSE